MKTKYNITKQQHIYTSEEKKKWLGYGEWVEELDCVFIEYLGYEAAIHRVVKREPCEEEAYFGGHLCGYIRIPEDHPYFGKADEDMDIDAHGGLTFAEVHEQCHWIGFDCGHSGDYVPSTEHMKRTIPELIAIRERYPPPPGFEKFHLFNPVYRNMQYCIDTCIEVIDQLIEVSKPSTREKSAQVLDEYEEKEPA